MSATRGVTRATGTVAATLKQGPRKRPAAMDARTQGVGWSGACMGSVVLAPLPPVSADGDCRAPSAKGTPACLERFGVQPHQQAQMRSGRRDLA